MAKIHSIREFTKYFTPLLEKNGEEGYFEKFTLSASKTSIRLTCKTAAKGKSK